MTNKPPISFPTIPSLDLTIKDIIDDLEVTGITSANGIAVELNARGITGPRGGGWSARSVLNFKDRLERTRSSTPGRGETRNVNGVSRVVGVVRNLDQIHPFLVNTLGYALLFAEPNNDNPAYPIVHYGTLSDGSLNALSVMIVPDLDNWQPRKRITNVQCTIANIEGAGQRKPDTIDGITYSVSCSSQDKLGLQSVVIDGTSTPEVDDLLKAILDLEYILGPEGSEVYVPGAARSSLLIANKPPVNVIERREMFFRQICFQLATENDLIDLQVACVASRLETSRLYKRQFWTSLYVRTGEILWEFFCIEDATQVPTDGQLAIGDLSEKAARKLKRTLARSASRIRHFPPLS